MTRLTNLLVFGTAFLAGSAFTAVPQGLRQTPPPSVTFVSNGSDIRISGFQRKTLKTNVNPLNGRLSFSGSGTPISVKSNKMGLNLHASHLSGIAESFPTVGYRITTFDAVGEALLSVKSLESQSTPASITTVTSAELIYEVKDKVGSAKSTGPFDLVRTSTGLTKVKVKSQSLAAPFTERITLLADSGSLVVTSAVSAPGPTPSLANANGHCRFSFDRKINVPPSAMAAAGMETDSLNGTADHLTIQFFPERTVLTAEGNVTANGLGPNESAQVSSVDRLIAIFDRKGNLITLDLTGSPVRATATEGGT